MLKIKEKAMTKRIQAKHKIDRRHGVNLWGRAKSPINTRAYAPGEHGAMKKPQKSDFGKQLYAKQLLKGFYGSISEKKFRKYYDEAVRRKGDTAENLIGLLESRLDAVVYRAKFVPTVFAARQLVNHAHVLVNGKKVNIASYNVKPGDVITIREKSKGMKLITEALASKERECPEYINCDEKKMEATYVKVPSFEEVPYAVVMEPNLIIEFYSR
jgi:small subunit ribosomal protein S4